MKTLENHLILYDAECPMCRVYTNAFVKSKMLDTEGREAYQKIPDEICPLVDRQRAVNEIALINRETGEVSYGINSLFLVIGNSFPLFKPLFNFRPFIGIMKQIYAFISYNRKVIIPGSETYQGTLQPTFRLDYRLLYLAFTWLLTSLILTSYAHLLKPLVPLGGKEREFLICGFQIVFQGIVILTYSKSKVWDYLGNMMTVSFAGALVLLPVIFLAKVIDMPPEFNLMYFLLVAALMLAEHIRRVKLLHLNWAQSLSWVVYRLIALYIILN